MSTTRSLPDKYYGKDGTHRVPIWRIAGFALNNTATNTYMFLMGYVSYYLGGFVGVSTVIAASFSMYMRIWDGVTDPFIGFVVDKTNGKFGKNRPFMVIGQLILCITSFILFHFTHKLPDNSKLRFGFFIVVAAIYYVGYTFQCVVTKSAQTCLTNDPKQRPLFSMFDAAYNTLLWTVMAIVAARISEKYGSTFYSTEVFHELWVICAIMSAVFTAIAVFSIAPKDRSEFFGTGKAVRVGLKDYWECLKHNRAIQMLVVSASSDKLASSMRTSTVQIVLFGVIIGDYTIYGTMNGIISIPTCILSMLFIGTLATSLGQRKAMLLGSWGGIVLNALLMLLWFFGDPASANSGNGIHWGFFAIAYVVLTLLCNGFQGISGNIVIPMTADCADYEVYRTGKYVPGMMGTLFSLVDKLISSFAPMLAGLAFAGIGFVDKLPDQQTPYSESLKVVAVLLMYATVIIGLICNIVALRFYPLTKEKMAEIQGEIAEIKAKAMAEGK